MNGPFRPLSRSLSMLFALLLLAPSLARAAAPPLNPQQELNLVEQQTIQIRQLKPLHPVKASFLADAAFNADFNAELHQETPDAEVALDQRESVVLGLLTRSDNLHRILFKDSAAQIAGFYDYQRGRLYVRNDGNAAFGAERYLIAHEFTHALQDQHYGLRTLLPDQFPLTYRNSDAVAAHHALTEGDAVVTEDLFIRQTYSRADLKALNALDSQPDSGPPLPVSIQRQLYFPYTTGVDFAQALYQRNGMAGIDAAYTRLPASTYEIIYPNAYLNGWRPVDVSLHSVTGFSDWQQVDDDVFGAFGYELLLWQFIGHTQANAVTKNYRGDRYIFLEKGKQSAFLFRSVWTNGSTARAAKDAFLAALRARFRHARVYSGAATVVVNGLTSVYLATSGPTLTMTYAPSRALATQLGTAPTT